MRTTTSDNLAFVSKIAAKIVEEVRGLGTLQGGNLFAKSTTSSLQMDYHTRTGIGQGSYLPEMVDPPDQNPGEGHSKSIRLSTYGNAIGFSERVKSMMPGEIKRDQGYLKDSWVETLEMWRYVFYSEALSGTTPSVQNGRQLIDQNSYDGVTYFHAAHTYKGSSAVNSNLSATVRTMSVSALVSMAQQARGWVDYNGFPLRTGFKSWVIAKNLIEDANVYVRTMKDPLTANNAINAMQFADNGSPATTLEVWDMLPDDHFMLRNKLGSSMPGFVEIVLKGEDYKQRTYMVTNSARAYKVDWQTTRFIGGIHWAEFLTHRAAAA